MWLLLWPIIFWAAAVVLAASLSYIRRRLEMPRTECILSVIFALLNSTAITLLGYQWVSYELDFDELNKQYPHIINVQCIVSHVLFFSFIGLCITCWGGYLLAKRTPSNHNRHVDNSRLQLLFCAFAVGGAWMITYPSSQAKDGQTYFGDLFKTGKYKELQDTLQSIANLHLALMILAWLLFYAGLCAYARGLHTLQSHILNYLYNRPSGFQHEVSAAVYSPDPPSRSEFGDLGAEFFSNRTLVELKAFDQHPTVRPDATATPHAHPRLPPQAFLGEENLSPSLVSIDTFDVEAPQTTPCSSVYRA
ncbi:hypothetical protein AJ78_01763 [Emergomyces pasteurianus Ep9510]|uniref:Uncharacterized protein n=1 Tax=Emergomyces pasteurianus Ep9510 TaxID=1447872 RepID=A0A1J9QSG6_9EURO|nr:hypothetical protein AJ78_01763 [Emergomyces pasteurianus Ep9510]